MPLRPQQPILLLPAGWLIGTAAGRHLLGVPAPWRVEEGQQLLLGGRPAVQPVPQQLLPSPALGGVPGQLLGAAACSQAERPARRALTVAVCTSWCAGTWCRGPRGLRRTGCVFALWQLTHDDNICPRRGTWVPAAGVPSLMTVARWRCCVCGRGWGSLSVTAVNKHHVCLAACWFMSL